VESTSWQPRRLPTEHDRKEISVNAKLTSFRNHIATILVASTLSVFISIGIIAAVVGMFLREGTPFEQLASAERACADYAFVAERDACVQSFLTASRAPNVASR
jgi:hypothetical protein